MTKHPKSPKNTGPGLSFQDLVAQIGNSVIKSMRDDIAAGKPPVKKKTNRKSNKV